jgi:hypothetical protein
MTLEEWEQKEDRELEEQLTALFQTAQPPAPPAGFVSRTMKAVRRAPLPEGRHPLRLPWVVPVGWAALVAAASAASYSALSHQRLAAEVLSSLVAFGVRAGLRLVQSVNGGSMVFDVLATMNRVMLRAMSTREATAGLMLMALVAAISLSMLNKLLFSEKESPSWSERS